jgi:hypothetical protein
MKKIIAIICLAVLLVECSTVPITGRKRLDLVSDAQALPASFAQYKGFLEKNKNNYEGTWNLFIIDELISQSIFFSIENVNGQSFEAYPFFGDKRFAGTWAGKPKKRK